MEPFVKSLLDYGLTGLLGAILIIVYIKIIRPDNKQRELERDKLISERMQSLIDVMRTKEQEHSAEKLAIRREHAEAWESQHKRIREDRDVAREERQQDREMFREMIAGMLTGLKSLQDGQDRGFGLTLALGERLGTSKKELVHRTESITGQKVGKQFTSDETNY